jgi:DNA-nicking Smr family endonuclease
MHWVSEWRTPPPRWPGDHTANPIAAQLASLAASRLNDGMSGQGNDSEHDDVSAFREAMGDVQQLQAEKAAPFRQRRRPEPLNLPVGDEQETGFADIPVETGDFLEFRRPGIQNRLFQDLRRGVIDTDGSLDLHGMRVHEARGALARFLGHSLATGRRCVRIIHGKGRGSGVQPVLKHKVNQWLRQRDEVLAFVTAPRWDGGTGAVYVLLSGKRRSV